MCAGTRTIVIRILVYTVVQLSLVHLLIAADGQWRNYTAMLQVRDAVHAGDTMYVAASGGIFRSVHRGETIETITTSEGLSAVDLTSVTIDANGNVYVGALGGMIDRYDPVTDTWNAILDITRTDFPTKDITVLRTRSDTLYVGTSFGVSIYSTSRREFNDSYIKFGGFPTQTAVTAIAYNDTYLWVGTELGVARGRLNDPLLAAPDRWETFSAQLPSAVVNDIAFFGDRPYVATDRGLAWFDGNQWHAVPSFTGQNVVSLAAGEVLYVATPFRVFSMDGNGAVTSYGDPLPGQISKLVFDGEYVSALVSSYGIARLNGAWQYIIPEGPLTNLLVDVAVADDGTVWIGTGAFSSTARGVSRLIPGVSAAWENYPASIYPELRTNAYHKVFVARDGSVWGSAWGGGISRFEPDGTITNYSRADGLTGDQADPNYVVTGRAGEDSFGNIWFTMRDAANRQPLARWSPEGTFTFFTNRRNPNAIRLMDLLVDRYDTKWMISVDPSQRGLFYYNEHEEIGTSVDGWGTVTTQHGIPSGTINVIVEDNRGEIWIGTDVGLAIITNPRDPQLSVRDLFVLQDQFINSIAVDPLNRKWIGTKDGVFLLSSDGTQLLVQYNVENTGNRLLSDDVLSVAFDGNRGIVYFGTERGLSSLTTEAVAPRTTFDDLFVAPNPYLIPADYQLKIDGLVRNSSVKILSMDGRLVRDFNSPGGRIAYWDGRDATGRHVASGVYIIVGISEDGSEVGKGKVTVVRK
jgi:ligand-binding sensor domain-containing protein